MQHDLLHLNPVRERQSSPVTMKFKKELQIENTSRKSEMCIMCADLLSVLTDCVLLIQDR